MITVRYFASLRENLGIEQETVENAVATVRDLRTLLAERHGSAWQQAAGGARLLVAVNQEMASDDQKVATGDEVAFFPPVTGG